MPNNTTTRSECLSKRLSECLNKRVRIKISEGNASTVWSEVYFKMLLWAVCVVLAPWALAEPAEAPPVQVKVDTHYIEVHTGPGRGYPVFHVVERHAPLTVLFERGGWIKVQTARGQMGWVPREALQETQDGTGAAPALLSSADDRFRNHWHVSLLGGAFDGASSLSAAAGYRFTENLTVESMYTQASGDFSNNRLLELNVQHEIFPRWRLSPYFMLGTGRAVIEPRATLVRPENREENYAQGGAGLKFYLARGFVLRSEYRSYVLFTEENQNRNLEEWKLGFSVLF